MIRRLSKEVTESALSAVRAAPLSGDFANTVAVASKISSMTSESTTSLYTSGRMLSSRDRRSETGARRAHLAKRDNAWCILMRVSYSARVFARRFIACAHAWADDTLLMVSSRARRAGRPSSSCRILQRKSQMCRPAGHWGSSEATKPVRHPDSS
jgi:hypothetical protein